MSDIYIKSAHTFIFLAELTTSKQAREVCSQKHIPNLTQITYNQYINKKLKL